MKKLLILLLFATILFPLLIAPAASANAAEPPSIIIIVPNAPADLEISLGQNIIARRMDKANESYFTFYRFDLQSTDYTLKVAASGVSFQLKLDPPPATYNNIYTLDLKRETLTPGKSFSRSFSLISLRVILTLMIEGLVFFLFGYRKKKSWLIFLTVNLLTQGALNVLINHSYIPTETYLGYTVFRLIFIEMLVFVVELVVFLNLLKEHGRPRAGLYVITANLLSLVAGGYLITFLPV